MMALELTPRRSGNLELALFESFNLARWILYTNTQRANLRAVEIQLAISALSLEKTTFL